MNGQRRSLVQTLIEVPAGWWVVLLTVPALLPLARAGFFISHDGIFHAYRLAALEQAVRAGVLYPRWFPEFAFGYGHPVLNFYGPLSYYWGLPFAFLGADAALATELTLATGLVASALGMYRLARLHLARGPALVAAVVYVYLPYHLIDLYVRGALAEFLAFVWNPLLLAAVHRLVYETDRGRVLLWGVLTALLAAALVATHSLSAFIFAPVSVGYVLLLWWRRRTWRTPGRVLAAGLLALALAAFYWLPVLLESRFVGLGHGASLGYRNHLLSWGELVSISPTYDYSLDPSQPSTFALGWLQASLLLVALVLPLVSRRRGLALFFLAVGLASTFMLLRASLPLWKILEGGLAFLQYPWRFQALAVLATALLAGLLLQALTRWRAWAALLLGGLLLVAIMISALAALPLAPQDADLSVEGMWQMDRHFGQLGATWTGEYVPIWVREQRWAISHPVPEPDTTNGRAVAGERALAGVGYTRYDLTLDAPLGTSLVLHQFYYPGWQAHWQGETIAAQPRGDLGLAAFDLPAGSGPLVLRLALTPAQRWGSLVSLAAALLAGVALVAHWQIVARGRRRAASLLVAAGCGLLAALLAGSLVLPNGYVRATTQIDANLAGLVELEAFRLEDTSYRPGEQVDVILYWTALQALDQDYKASVQLTDVALTRQPAQHDGDPGGGFTPTSRWLPGELVPDEHHLLLPPDLAPGRYRLWAAMYRFPEVENLAVLSAGVPHDENRVLLAEIEVLAP